MVLDGSVGFGDGLVVGGDRQPGERRVAADRHVEAVAPRRELDVGRERADGDGVALVDGGVDERGAGRDEPAVGEEEDVPRRAEVGGRPVRKLDGAVVGRGVDEEGEAAPLREGELRRERVAGGGDCRVAPDVEEIVGLDRPAVPLEVEVGVDHVEDVPPLRDRHSDGEVERRRRRGGAVARGVASRDDGRRERDWNHQIGQRQAPPRGKLQQPYHFGAEPSHRPP